ncbi:hypothetical protein Leryth_007629 [Lithospermum erythrorhizon]|nr:hypothetical protein Leryth_007629 [Lithospermum erythrorhizon]
MKPYLLISLLLVSFLVNQTQGDESRKLLTKTTPSYTMINHTTSKKYKNKGSESEHKMKVQSNRSETNLVKMKKENVVSVVIENHHQHHPDILEVDEMDYSTAMRKPPVHN